MSYWVILKRCVHGNFSTSSIFSQGWEIIQWSNLVRSWLLDSLKSWLTVGSPISSQLHLQISKLTTSFSQNPNLKRFILCSNFLFIFYFFYMLDLPPIKEKWIQHFLLLQADPHTPQNAPPPSQKIDWTFPQNKTFYDRVVTWSLNFEGCNLRESCVEMLKIFSLMESVKIWSCSYSFDHPSNDNLFIWCWVFGSFILSQSLGSLFVIPCFFCGSGM